MYIWVQGEWDHVNGVLLETEQKIGIVKVFDDYLGDVTCVPDFTSDQRNRNCGFPILIKRTVLLMGKRLYKRRRVVNLYK